MNCKQLNELLPLYAGRDLDEKRARLVSEHVQICSACAQLAGEYREAVELTQDFAPPGFSDHVYASVRRQVMQQIEDEPADLLPTLGQDRRRVADEGAAIEAVRRQAGATALHDAVQARTEVRPHDLAADADGD